MGFKIVFFVKGIVMGECGDRVIVDDLNNIKRVDLDVVLNEVL